MNAEVSLSTSYNAIGAGLFGQCQETIFNIDIYNRPRVKFKYTN